MTRRHGKLARYKYGPDEHGTPGKGCRCPECREAGNSYERDRDRKIAYGRWKPFVPADRARAHAAWLRSCGLGPGQIGRLAGLSAAGITALLDGRPGCPPTKKVRPETETAILAVRPHLDLMSPGTLVDSAGTRRRVEALAWLGWPVKTVGDMAGVGHLGERVSQDHVSAACARAIRDVYDKLWNQSPPEGTTAEKRAASRARDKARRERWPSAGAWDDDPGPHCIDDPAAKPAPGWERAEVQTPSGSASVAAVIRQAREAAGLSRPRLAVVLGVSAQAVKHWEDGVRTPGPESWEQLELALGPLGIVRKPARRTGDGDGGREGEEAA